jgi:hypothetical protein
MFVDNICASKGPDCQHSCSAALHGAVTLLLACECTRLYRVIRKSVKHFKNSQQIDYAMDHDNSYSNREKNYPSLFYIISHMLNVSAFDNTADVFHTRVSISRSTIFVTTAPSRKSG